MSTYIFGRVTSRYSYKDKLLWVCRVGRRGGAKKGKRSKVHRLIYNLMGGEGSS